MNKETYFSPKPPVRDIKPQKINCLDHKGMAYEYFINSFIKTNNKKGE